MLTQKRIDPITSQEAGDQRMTGDPCYDKATGALMGHSPVSTVEDLKEPKE